MRGLLKPLMQRYFHVPEFKEFSKISRFYEQDVYITEKIDGTNGCIYIYRDTDQMGYEDAYLTMMVGSRTRWITPEDDNYGFARWARENQNELLKLGEGYHYGEWWGQGIQRGYGMKKKVFSLFNTYRWSDPEVRPACCDVVPVLYAGPVTPEMVEIYSKPLAHSEAAAVYGIQFDKPEGVMMYFTNANMYFKAPSKKGHKG